LAILATGFLDFDLEAAFFVEVVERLRRAGDLAVFFFAAVRDLDFVTVANERVKKPAGSAQEAAEQGVKDEKLLTAISQEKRESSNIEDLLKSNFTRETRESTSTERGQGESFRTSGRERRP
jgi:hypothetical protein